jgi:hypothetical protein
MILRNARRDSPTVGKLRAEEFLEIAGSTRSLSWFHDLENGRKTVPAWPEWSALCQAAGIDPAKTAKGELP